MWLLLSGHLKVLLVTGDWLEPELLWYQRVLPGTVKTTLGGAMAWLGTIKATFKDFATPYDCVNHLVTQWYKDYKGYKASIVLSHGKIVLISKTRGLCNRSAVPSETN